LFRAIESRDLKLFKENLKCCSISDLMKIDEEGSSLLHIVAGSGWTEALSALLDILPEFRNTINTTNEADETPMCLAVTSGNPNVVLLLVRNGGKVNWVNSYNESALYFAAYHGHSTVAYILIKNGCELNTVTTDGVTAERIATIRGHQRLSVLLRRAKKWKIIRLLYISFYRENRSVCLFARLPLPIVRIIARYVSP